MQNSYKASMKMLVAGILIFFFTADFALAQSTDTSLNDLEFTDIAPDSGMSDSAVKDTQVVTTAIATKVSDSASLSTANAGTDAASSDRASSAQQTLWETFLAGLAGGFLAFLMPCIFPMVPLTISYFTK
ncbi:MAG: hypothetical protein V4594_04430, partial [Bacteroidota bacterium]